MPYEPTLLAMRHDDPTIAEFAVELARMLDPGLDGSTGTWTSWRTHREQAVTRAVAARVGREVVYVNSIGATDG